MIAATPATRVFLFEGAVDMLKGFEGLSALVRDKLGEDMAVPLAQNPKELEALKARVRTQVESSRLSDSTAFTQGVEAALLQCKPKPIKG